MEKNLFSREEFASKTAVAEVILDEWTKAKLLKPAGFTEEGVPLYAASDLGRAAHIQKLIELGYGLEEIQKIVKKFGLPRDQREAKQKTSAGKFLTVGELAERAGISPRTVKHWEDVGIIEPDMRSGGGFRLYSDVYVYLCKLIRDLQLFGYTLEEIKVISGYFRDFLAIQKDSQGFPPDETARRLDEMLAAIDALYEKTRLLKDGISRWEDLVKKKKKDILGLKDKNRKRRVKPEGGGHA